MVRLRVLLYLWRVLPLPEPLRWLITWLGNPHYAAGAAAIIRDEQGRVLLFEHTYRVKHAWGLPGGWIRRGERPEDAVVRELREEGGLEVVAERQALAELDRRHRHITFFYHCRVVGGAFRPSAEVRSCAYFPLDALPDVFPSQRRQLARILAAGALSRPDLRCS